MASNTPIQAGIIDKISKLFSKLFDSFTDLNVNVSDQQDIEEERDGETKVVGQMFVVTTEAGHKVKVKIVETAASKSYVDMYVLADNGQKKAFNRIKQEDAPIKLADFITDVYGEVIDQVDDKGETELTDEDVDFDESDLESLQESTRIEVELTRISGSQGIEYGRIYANYDLANAYDDLCEIVEDGDFQSTLPEDEMVCVQIIPEEDAFNVQTIDEISTADCPEREIFKVLLAAWLTTQDYRRVNTESEYIWDIETMYTGWRDIYRNSLPSLGTILEEIDLSSIRADNIDFYVHKLSLVFDMYYEWFDHDIKSLIDQWMLTLRRLENSNN